MRIRLEVEHRSGLQVEDSALDLEHRGVDSGECQRLAAQGIVGNHDVGHLEPDGRTRVLRQRGRRILKIHRWRLVDVGHGDRQGGRIVGRSCDRRVVHLDGNVELRIRLEVEHRSGLQVENSALDLEQRGVDSGECQRLAAQRIVSNHDVGHLDPDGRTRVLRQCGRRILKSHRRRLVDVGHGDGQYGRIVGRGSDTYIVDLDGNVELRVRLEIEHRAGNQEEFAAEDLEHGRVGAGEAQNVGAQAVVGNDDIGDLDPTRRNSILGQSRDRALKGHGRRQCDILVPGDLVVCNRRREHVQIAIAVYVRGKHGMGASGLRSDRVSGELLGAVVLVPVDLVAVQCRRKHVQVAVAIDVGGKYGNGVDGRRGNRVLREYLAAVVLVPRDLVVRNRCGKHVRVAVVIHIRREYGAGRVRRRGDRVGRESAHTVVFVPGNLAVVARRRKRVHIAVAIHVCCEHGKGTVGRRADGVRREGLAAVVLVPCDHIIQIGRREHIHIAIAVHIRCVHGKRSVGRRSDRAGHKGPAAVVFVPGDRVALWCRGEGVHVTVAVYVDGEHRAGCECRGCDRVGHKPLAAVVLIPGDPVVVGRGRKNIHVAVTVHISREYAAGGIGRGHDGPPCEVLGTVVLVPGDSGLIKRCAGHVDIPVAVQVRREDRTGTIDPRSDLACGEVLGSVVLVPGNLIVVERRREHVQIAVAIHVLDIDHPGAVRRCGDCVRSEILGAVVLVPGDRIVVKGCGNHIDIAVFVQVGGKHRSGTIGGRGDRVDREVLRAVVFVPGNRVVFDRCREDVHVAVAVHVLRKHGDGAVGRCRNGMGNEDSDPVVFIPGNRVVVIRRGKHVLVAVAVHVRGEHAPGTIGRRADHGRSEVLIAVVLEPDDSVVLRRRREHVHVAVAVDVDSRHRLDLANPGDDQMRCEVLAAVVLVPGDLVAAGRGREQVLVPVAVHIDDTNIAWVRTLLGKGPRGEEGSTGFFRRRDRDQVILHLAVGGRSGGSEPSNRAQAEAGIRLPLGRPTGNVEDQAVVTRHDGDIAGNLFHRPAPRTVAVEVDPGVELRAARCVLDVHGHACAEPPHLNRTQGDAVLVVGRAIGIVAAGVRGRDAVELEVALAAQGGTGRRVAGAVQNQRRCIRQRSVAEIELLSVTEVDVLHKAAGHQDDCMGAGQASVGGRDIHIEKSARVAGNKVGVEVIEGHRHSVVTDRKAERPVRCDEGFRTIGPNIDAPVAGSFPVVYEQIDMAVGVVGHEIGRGGEEGNVTPVVTEFGSVASTVSGHRTHAAGYQLRCAGQAIPNKDIGGGVEITRYDVVGVGDKGDVTPVTADRGVV